MTAGDVVELRGLRVLAVIGVLPEELERAQPVELDLDVHLDLALAGTSDNLGDTVDYGHLCQVAANVATVGHVALLEALAERIAAAVLEADGRIAAVTVVARKLRPPVPQDLGTAGVRITRTR